MRRFNPTKRNAKNITPKPETAADCARRAQLAHDSIAPRTRYYNQQLAGGKWQGMLSMQLRGLPVLQAPAAVAFAPDTTQIWGVSPDGPAARRLGAAGRGATAGPAHVFQPRALSTCI